MGMLEGNVKIRADSFLLHDFKKRVVYFIGISVENADPFEFWNGKELAEERGQSILETKVAAEIGCILGDKVDFLDSTGTKLFNLLEDGSDRPRAVRSLNEGNGAEGALVGAAFRYLDISP
jgi:hypothetical protein